MRRFVRQTRAGFIALASVAALIHLVGVANTPGRVSTLAHGAGRGVDALTFLGPGPRRRVLSTCAVGERFDSSQADGEQCIPCVEGQTSSGLSDATCDCTPSFIFIISCTSRVSALVPVCAATRLTLSSTELIEMPRCSLTCHTELIEMPRA